MSFLEVFYLFYHGPELVAVLYDAGAFILSDPAEDRLHLHPRLHLLWLDIHELATLTPSISSMRAKT